ncbi:hypothetical protein PGB90_008655 [Kerria lacca]
MTSEFESESVVQNSESQSHVEKDGSGESDININLFQPISAVGISRLSVSGPSLQSTVKVEGRKESNINRFKVCPLLLRIFYSYGRHHNPLDYKNKEYPKNELQIHTWLDATLLEIITNLQRKNRKIRRSGTVIKFQIISPDPARPRFKTRDIGSVKIDYKGPDDFKTLSQCRFAIGDFIDLCIRLPKN